MARKKHTDNRVKDTNQIHALPLLKDSLSDISLKTGMPNVEAAYSVIEDK
jgi:hypothetical protein